MNIVADRHQFRARIIPEFLTVLPLLLLLVSHVQDMLVLGFLSFALFFVFFQGHFSSRLGRKLESKLRKNEQLKSNSDFLLELYDKHPEDRYISNFEEAAEKANETSPFLLSKKEEQAKQINLVISWLRDNTRDVERFPAVFDKLCDYNFHRNMLALRIWALGVSLLALILFVIPIITVQLFPNITLEFTHRLGDGYEIEFFSTSILLVVGWVVFWTRVISLKALQRANKNYLKTLLRTSSSVEPANKTSSQEVSI